MTICLTPTLHAQIASAIEGNEIDVTHWTSEEADSYSTKVLQVAQDTIIECMPEERETLKGAGMMADPFGYISVAKSLYAMQATAVDAFCVAGLIVLMHDAVA